MEAASGRIASRLNHQHSHPKFSLGVFFLSALFTPKPINDIVQSYLLEMIWDGEKIAEVNEVNHIDI
ncbi:TPA: hypothetical protein I7670_02015 [Vibrio vulnificus]|nr:hypothetical protein [Vibrio vulnificus]